MRYQYITSKIWHDEKFTNLSADAQRLFFYILTCPHSNIIGLYVLKPGYACEDLRCTGKDFERTLKALTDALFVSYDGSTGVIYIRNFLKHNPLTNPNQIKGARKIFSQLPKSPLLLTFSQVHTSLTEGLTEGLNEGLQKDFTNPSYTVSGSESVSEPETGPVSGTETDASDRVVPFAEIIKDLNEKTGKNYYASSKQTREMIRALWKQGYRLKDFQAVHENMAAKWKNDPKMNQYLRPVTLYQGSKFEGYRNAEIFASDTGKVSTLTERNLQVIKNFSKGESHAI